MQTKKGSFIEQLCNVGSGFIVALTYWQIAIVPQVQGAELTFALNMSITAQFTVISVIRGYCWRRLFNWHTIRNRDQLGPCYQCGKIYTLNSQMCYLCMRKE